MINFKYYTLLIIMVGFIFKPCRATEDPHRFYYNDNSYNIHTGTKEDKKREIKENIYSVVPLEKNKNIITNAIKRIERNIERYIENRIEEKQQEHEPLTVHEIEKEEDVVYQRAMIKELKKLRHNIKDELTDNEVDILISRIQRKYYPEDGDGI